MSRFKIRPYEPKDFQAVYEVCLKTGDAGSDASHLYDDPDILGHIYVGPYVTLEPELAFVLEDAQSVCGYVLGALDSAVFYQRVVSEWLPDIQKQVPDPPGEAKDWTPTEQLYHEVHHPDISLPKALKAYPSHSHIDLLPRAQGQGNGKRMMVKLLEALKKQTSPAVHLGMHPDNDRAFHFYKKLGFQVLDDPSLDKGTLYLGKIL